MLHVICSCHKVHTSAERPFRRFVPDLLSGLVHLSKVLQHSDVTCAIRRKLSEEVHNRVEIRPLGTLPAHVQNMKEHACRMFLPEKAQCQKKAGMELLLHLLNGDWTRRATIIHHCDGHCCESKAATSGKLQHLFCKVLLGLRNNMLNLSNWKSWHCQVNFFAWAAILHHVVVDVMLMVVGGSPERGLAPGVRAVEPVDIPNADAGENEGHNGAEGAAANVIADPVQAAREELAKSTKIAITFLQSNFLSQLWVMRGSLVGQIRLMATLLHSVSKAYIVGNLHKQRYGLRPEFRILALHKQTATQEMLRETLASVKDATMWAWMPETEDRSTLIFKMAFCSAAHVWQLVMQRFTAWPWRIFVLLEDQTEVQARELLESAPCLRDPWTQKFMSKYATPAALVSEEAIQTLWALATMIEGNTFTTERLHSRNLRQMARRVQAKAMDITQLAWHHVATPGPFWLPSTPLTDQKKRKRGRPKKAEGRARKLTKQNRPKLVGGGGAWRAFLHERAGQFKTGDLTALAAEYHALSPEEWQRFQMLGALGQSGSSS